MLRPGNDRGNPMTTTAPAYDLVLNGGTVLDPAQGIHDRRDVAFKDGLVAAITDASTRLRQQRRSMLLGS